MRKGFTFLAALACTATLIQPVAAADALPADTVVATVNGEQITLGHLIVAYATLPQQYQQLPSEVLFDGLLDQLIQQVALAQTHDPEIPARIELSLENERRSLIAANVVEHAMQGAASEAEIKAAYDAKYAGTVDALEFDASHILVETEEEAQAIVAELRGGADFADMARAKSTGPSGPRGGALGWFGKGAMVPEFEAAVVAMEPGTVSDPVQTQFGWHVIRLNDTRVKSAPPLDEVREEIALEIQKGAVDTLIAELVDAATVDRPAIEGLDKDIIRNIGALGN